jgi:hypothetical protein
MAVAIGSIVGTVIGLILAFVLLGIVFMIGWNLAMPAAVGAPEIGVVPGIGFVLMGRAILALSNTRAARVEAE